jgi:hypothetical protein
MRSVRLISVACLSALAIVGAAWADIAAFNAAVRAGDYKTAAVEAKGAWRDFDKTSAATATVAREFGFVSYVAGDFAAAREYGVFLRDNGATLPKPDDEPEASAVLLQAAEYRLNPKGPAREQLLAALRARAAGSGVDNISVVAAEAFYRTEWSQGAWVRARAGAEIAAEMLGRADEGWRFRALQARMTAAAAGFLQSQTQESYDQMVQLHDDVVGMLDVTTDAQARAPLLDVYFHSRAWTTAMSSAEARKAATGTRLAQGIKTRALKRPAEPVLPMNTAADMCKGEVVAKPVLYPESAFFTGTVGAILVRVDFNAKGAAVDHEILAAVPAKHFSEAVETSAKSLRLARAKDDAPECRLDDRNRVVEYIFSIP